MVVGFLSGFAVGFAEGSFWFNDGLGILVGELLSAVAGAEVDFGWVGGRGKPFARSKYSPYFWKIVDIFISSLTIPSYSTTGLRSSSGS